MAEASASLKKLASIVAVDVAGYSRRSEADEDGAIRAVGVLRDRIGRAAKEHGGRVFNSAGDGFMLEFPTASGALAAAEEIAASGDPPVRVGVHLGEVSSTAEGDLLGHGVNVAARLQQMASPGAVLVSGDVKRAIRGALGARLRPQGSVRLEKMSEIVPIFALASESGGPTRGRRTKLPLLQIGIAIAAAAMLVAGVGVFRSRFWAQPPPDRIAILPFSTLGGGEETKAFAAGLTDDLASVLSGNGRPIVSGPDAQTLTGPAAADQVRRRKVRLMFGGSVEREGDQLKVRVRLDDPLHDVTLWTEAMEAPAAQSEQLQGQLGARIIAVLNCTSRALRPKGGLYEPDALTLLLKACDIFEDQATNDNSRAVLGLLDTSRQLVARAPGFAAGHSMLAKFAAYYRTFLPPTMNDQLVRETKAESDAALRLDPTDIDARVARYLLIPTADFVDRDKAIMGVPFDPTWPYGENFKGVFLGDVGRSGEALAATQRAVAANPLSTDADAVQWLLLNGKTQAASQEFARLMRLWPANFLWIDRLVLYETIGDWKGLQTFLTTPAQQPSALSVADLDRIRLEVEAGRTRAPAALARARSSILAPRSATPITLGNQVLQLSWLGFVDDAFAVAGRIPRSALSTDNTTMVLFLPQARAMRQDRRFIALAAHFGLLDYWTKTGKWPDFCSEPGLPYDCKIEAAKLSGGHS